MSRTNAPADRPTARASEPRRRYDAFISYSHADRPIAKGLQQGLQRIGRRMGQLHALRVFRDDTDLAADPDLWGRVTEAMDRSRYLIVVLSPHARASQWVDREVAYWRDLRGMDQLLLVLAGGSLDWDDGAGRFHPEHSDACPLVLTELGAFDHQPLYVDVSDDAPWDPGAAVFRDKAATLAAPIHGRSKYALSSDDVREQRRFRRWRRAAVASLVCVTAVAIATAFVAIDQREEARSQQREAVRQRNAAVSLNLASASHDLAVSNDALALALAAESAGVVGSVSGEPLSALVGCEAGVRRSALARDRITNTPAGHAVGAGRRAPTQTS